MKFWYKLAALFLLILCLIACLIACEDEADIFYGGKKENLITTDAGTDSEDTQSGTGGMINAGADTDLKTASESSEDTDAGTDSEDTQSGTGGMINAGVDTNNKWGELNPIG